MEVRMLIDKVCPKCNTNFVDEVRKGYGKTFCSRACANSRVRDADTKRKISETAKASWNSRSEESKKNSIDALRNGSAILKKKSIIRVASTNTECLGHTSRKKKVFLEQRSRCNKCGIGDWNGMPLSFELEHKDGNKHNNMRDNLEVLCPNCHSQTHTWRGRNNKRA